MRRVALSVAVICILGLMACDDDELARLGLCDPAPGDLIYGLPPFCPEFADPKAERYEPDPNPPRLKRPRFPASPTPYPPFKAYAAQVGSCEEDMMTEPLTREAIKVVQGRYRDLFRRQPHYIGTWVRKLLDESGEETDRLGIVVHVEQKTDPETQDAADRIPSCLDGVPVEVRVDEPFVYAVLGGDE